MSPIRLITRGVAATMFGLALAAPYLLSPSGIGHAARVAGYGRFIALAGAIVLPLVMAAAFARDHAGPIPMRWLSFSILRHPIATLSALAVVPVAVVLTEALLFALSYHFNMLCFFLVDLFPDGESALPLFHLSDRANYGFGVPAEDPFLRMYLYRLGQGYSLSGAVPPSLTLWPEIALRMHSGTMTNTQYFLGRMPLTLIAAICMFLALSLQARWIGVVSKLETRPV